MTEGTTGSATGQSLKDRLAPIVGVGAMVIYVAGLILLALNLSAPEALWVRAVFLLTGIEAIAFAAAGFFFGREVNRQRAESAETAAATASAKADEAIGQAAEANAKGQALATAIRSHEQPLIGVPFGAPTGTSSAQPNLGYLTDLADQFFPS